MRVATAALLGLMGCQAAGTSAGGQVQVTHGPILGRLGAREVGVWVRTSRAGTFHVRYGTAPDRLDQRSSGAETRPDRDLTGWVLLTGLRPNTKYWYDVAGVGGSFRTLPDAETFRDPAHNPRGLFNFRFEFACGNNQNPGQGSGPELPAFRTMLRELKDRIHFAILNGDWLYESRRDFPAEAWRGRLGLRPEETPPVVRHAPAIVGVWENYKLFLDQGKNLTAWHREIPSFFTFDDHEILNDVWGAGTPGLRDRRAVFRDIGVQAWYDYLGWSNPTAYAQGIRFGRARLRAGSDVLSDPEADFRSLDLGQAATLHVHWGGPTAGVNDNALDGVGGDPNAGVYEILEVLGKDRLRIRPAAKHDGEPSYSIGRRSFGRFRVSNCDFFLLDTRTHREMHDTRRPDQPGLSMLGKDQKEWLLGAMRSSDADFFFVVSSVNFMVPHVGGGAVRAENKDDAWTVFVDEREQLIRAWDALGKPVFVLTGDLHNSFAIKITDRVWEFASGPHNSNNHIARDEGDRPASGPFDSRGRPCEIRWSSYFLNDVPRDQLLHPLYCVVQVNNVFNSPLKVGEERWVAYPRPQVVIQYYDGRTGELRYAEAVTR
jgi:phosphodiesterase/alkaline phosphatase D-like protein